MLNAENARVKKRKHWLLFSCRWMVGSLAATFESTFPQEYFQKYFWWKSEAQKPRSRPYITMLKFRLLLRVYCFTSML